jgi:molybdopterin molybdotransferase
VNGAISWADARALASGVASRLPVAAVPLDRADALVLAEPLRARCDLPPFDASAMDGWAVCGPGPWQVRAGQGLAGSVTPPLRHGEAAATATGARLPDGTTAVLRREHGRVADGRLAAVLPDSEALERGRDIRPRGQECRGGDALLPAGAEVTPAVLGLAGAAGYDELPVIRRARVELYLLGDELLSSGLPREGRVRDALGPLLPGWLRALGAEVVVAARLKDTADALADALRDSAADLVLTTGGTARGPVDHLHEVLAEVGAELLVDGVAVRPGHPMVLARLARSPERFLVGLPGNPLAATSGMLTLVELVLAALQGHPPAPATTVTLAEPVTGHPVDTRLVPVRGVVPLHFTGPAMLRGFALADGMAVVPPGGTTAGAEAELLAVPWRRRARV